MSRDPERSGFGEPIHGVSARPEPSRLARAGQIGKSVGRGVGRGAQAVAQRTGALGRATFRVTRRATQAQGAGETGLSRLIETHALHNAGDAVVALSLAGTLFFQVPSGEAKGQVALFLLLTLLPFSIIAPFVGPFLDRFRHGRRWAIGATLAIRAFLCWALADSIGESSWWQFPAALGVLVASKAYNVTRAAATPRLLPSGMSLVKANGRMSLAGVIGAAVAGPIAALLAQIGPQWSLRFGFAIFALGTVLAIMLPRDVDSARGERQVGVAELAGGARSSRWGVPRDVVVALRGNFGLRMLSGFLTIFLAFLLRTNPPAGWEDRFTLLLGLAVVGAGAGSALGTLAASLLRTASPMLLVRLALVIDIVAAVAAAVSFTIVTMMLLSLAAGLCQTIGKFGLDATIQEQVPEETRTSVFGRSETMIQLAWVIGGALGVILPTEPRLGMGLLAMLLTGWLVVVLRAPRRPSAADPGSSGPASGRSGDDTGGPTHGPPPSPLGGPISYPS